MEDLFTGLTKAREKHIDANCETAFLHSDFNPRDNAHTGRTEKMSCPRQPFHGFRDNPIHYY